MAKKKYTVTVPEVHYSTYEVVASSVEEALATTLANGTIMDTDYSHTENTGWRIELPEDEIDMLLVKEPINLTELPSGTPVSGIVELISPKCNSTKIAQLAINQLVSDPKRFHLVSMAEVEGRNGAKPNSALYYISGGVLSKQGHHRERTGEK